MGLVGEVLASGLILREAVEETLWPTRCAICDLPGELLCARCARNLAYLDQLQACPVCGAPWGRGICTECNRMILEWKGLERIPLNGCVSATVLTPQTRRIVTTFKDRGELRLANVLAQAMANVMPPAWVKNAALVPIPARKQAERQRGYDHIALVAEALSQRTGLTVVSALEMLPRKDQRALDAKQRLQNMAGSIRVKPAEAWKLRFTERIVLVDDVFTTGATLFTAASALRPYTKEICAVTFTRV